MRQNTLSKITTLRVETFPLNPTRQKFTTLWESFATVIITPYKRNYSVSICVYSYLNPDNRFHIKESHSFVHYICQQWSHYRRGINWINLSSFVDRLVVPGPATHNAVVPYKEPQRESGGLRIETPRRLSMSISFLSMRTRYITCVIYQHLLISIGGLWLVNWIILNAVVRYTCWPSTVAFNRYSNVTTLFTLDRTDNL